MPNIKLKTRTQVLAAYGSDQMLVLVVKNTSEGKIHELERAIRRVLAEVQL